jgi:hypothetical protein
VPGATRPRSRAILGRWLDPGSDRDT